MDNIFGFQFDTSYSALPDCLHSNEKPTGCDSPTLILLNQELAKDLGLNLSDIESKEQAALFAGTRLLPTANYIAQAYAGHQFGHFTILGDGRALLWGEHLTPSNTRVDIQFKGSGRTSYSRGGDGYAVLGPMLREYIISEAMHALGIKTTRSLAVVTTGESVRREELLPGAILTRVASSHLRVGTFQFAAIQADDSILETLFNYTIERHYPELLNAENPALSLLNAVMARQIDLIVDWMRVGFIHGVMNTDNMSIAGETIDYGPCAFMDHYDPDTCFSSIDHNRRYAYANQPFIAQWNLTRLAEALLPVIAKDADHAVTLAEDVLNTFPERYQTRWLAMMAAKLGLKDSQDGDPKLVADLLRWMQNNHLDYTNTFRTLSQHDKPSGDNYATAEFTDWHQRWQMRLQQDSNSLDEAITLMQKSNPAIIPRNHLVEQALSAAHRADYDDLFNLIAALQDPYGINHAAKYVAPASPTERVYQTFCGT